MSTVPNVLLVFDPSGPATGLSLSCRSYGRVLRKWVVERVESLAPELRMESLPETRASDRFVSFMPNMRRLEKYVGAVP